MSFTESGHWMKMFESIIYLKALCSCWLPPSIYFSPSLTLLLCLWLSVSPSLCVCLPKHPPPFWLSLSIFLSHPSDLHVEGLFRVPGHSLRQAALREMLNTGAEIDLETGDFHPNDAATLLKAYLGELPEPLLTHRHYHAHLKIGGAGWLVHRSLSFRLMHGQEKYCLPVLCNIFRHLFLELTRFDDQGDKTNVPDKERQIEAFQLLFMLLPSANRSLLKLLFDLLHSTARNQHSNKMSAINLAKMFAPHIIWPKNVKTLGSFCSVFRNAVCSQMNHDK